jgi:hypothetical protein
MFEKIGTKDAAPLVLPILELLNRTLDIPLPQTRFNCI